MEVLSQIPWPHAVRPHKGVVLQEFKNVSGVVGPLAWDAPRQVLLTEEQVCKHYRLHSLMHITRSTTPKTLNYRRTPASPQSYK